MSLIKHKPIIWAAALVTAISLAGSYFYLTATSSAVESSQAQEGSSLQQAVARTGELTLSVSGTGVLAPAATTELGFQEKGTLLELNVDVGDEVQAGDVLARLEIDRTPAELQADIASAELAVVRAQQNLDQLYEHAQLEAAQALSALEDARQALEEINIIDAQLASAQREVAQAKEELAEAELQLALLNASPSQASLDIAYSSLLFKEKDLQELETEVARVENKIKSAPDKPTRDRLKTQLLSLEIRLLDMQADYQRALYSYNTMGDPPDPVEQSVAEAQLATARARLEDALQKLEQIQAGPEGSAIALAEAQVSQAEDEWERLKDGPDPGEVALAEAQLAQAQAKLDLVQREQLVLDLVAPVDATVIAVNAAVGDRIGSQPILTLADLDQLQVEVYIDETDLANVQVGNRVVVVFDALPEVTFSGEIVTVDPGLRSMGNTTALRVLAELQAGTAAITLPIGLNAAVEIIAGQVENAVLVPLEAVHQETQSGYYVYVIEGETLVRRPVEVGLMDLTTAEITSGLLPGEVVAAGIPDLEQE